ncbi:hypothetical protein [Flavobacterium sp. MK4S-17]|uniref:hypothetical protein n=1 Tax=Flavobacterium sp. MK4S-17 TaxID=2543737 RepID=UPI0013577A21|nr:hypothetical protein [Flavobacterium sp. MK4S-17]
MKEHFKTILEAFENAGVEVSRAEFSITEYSLNTPLSFKFNDLDELLEFLNLANIANDKRTEAIKNVFAEEGIDHQNFFYVNFYTPKVAEL